jgi:hypothetical protein
MDHRRWNLALLGALTGVCLGGSVALAQMPIGGYTPPIQQQPVLPPILNLNRPGTNPAINYYGLVKPQQQTQQQLQNLQYNQNQLMSAAGSAALTLPANEPVPLSTTGHPVFYFDYSKYFPLQGLPGNYAGGTAVPGGTGGSPFGATGLRPGVFSNFGATPR